MSITIEIPKSVHHLLQPQEVPMRRLGNPHDGGYLVPQAALRPPLAVVSLGMKDDWSFEQDVVRLCADTIVHSYDPTVSIATMFRSIWTGVGLLVRGKNLTLWGRSKVFASYLTFFRGKNRIHFREWAGDSKDSRQATTADAVLHRIGKNRSILLKIDIEGDEYEFLDQILESSHFNQVAAMFIEFHDLDDRWERFTKLQERLLTKFRLVHVHANNMNKVVNDLGIPRVLELSFVRKGVTPDGPPRDKLPLPGLDFSNDLGSEDFELVFPR